MRVVVDPPAAALGLISAGFKIPTERLFGGVALAAASRQNTLNAIDLFGPRVLPNVVQKLG
eukprot:1687335-Pyramimonas_sp.AAC.1